MINFINKLFPPRSRVAVLLTVATNFIVYYGALFINSGRIHKSTEIALDGLIPLLPFTVFIYFGAFLQWAVNYVHLSQCEKAFCYDICSGLTIAKLICLLIFLIYPTAVANIPQVSGSGFSAFCLNFLYKIDGPSTNLFPSIHCLESWFCLRVAFSSSRSTKWYKIFSALFTLLVFVSVLTTKQHYFIDIPAGIIAVEAGLFISRKIKAERFYLFLDKKIRREEK